jgi:hypothetical protein
MYLDLYQVVSDGFGDDPTLLMDKDILILVFKIMSHLHVMNFNC